MTRIIAHRGARSIAPENTIAAAKKGFESGADLWETDIRVTRDLHFIIFHDESLERTTDVNEKFFERSSFLVKDFTLKEIQSLNPGQHFIENDPFFEIKKGHISKTDILSYQNEKVPTLEQALAFTKQNSWQVNLEIKFQNLSCENFSITKEIVKIVKHSRIKSDQVIFSSFHHDWLREILSIAPEFQVQALLGNTGETALDFKNYEFATYNVNNDLISEKDIQKLKSLGKKINVFTVNEKEDFLKLKNAGVDGVITDYPQLFVLNKKS